MGDWVRNFGAAGMVDGGMGVIDGIVARERESGRRSREQAGSPLPLVPYEITFETGDQAREWVRRNPGRAIARNPSEDGFTAKPTPTWKAALSALELIRGWPSGGDHCPGNPRRYRGAIFDYELDTQRIVVSMYVESKWTVVGELGREEFLGCASDPESFRTKVDRLLDRAGAGPAQHAQRFGPWRPPSINGAVALALIASWQGVPRVGHRHLADGPVHYRGVAFDCDPASDEIRLAWSEWLSREIGSIPLDALRKCHARGESFRAHVDALLDRLGAANAPDVDSPAVAWESHPAREALVTIAGIESPWAVAPPRSLFGGLPVRPLENGLAISCQTGIWLPYRVFTPDEIRLTGHLDNFLGIIKGTIEWLTQDDYLSYWALSLHKRLTEYERIFAPVSP